MARAVAAHGQRRDGNHTSVIGVSNQKKKVHKDCTGDQSSLPESMEVVVTGQEDELHPELRRGGATQRVAIC